MKQATNSLEDQGSARPTSQKQSADLVSRAKNGDEAAFSELYDQYYPVVHRRVWHMVPENDVEDVAQEVFLAAIKSLPKFRREAKFSTWLHTLTSRQVANYYRKRERSPKQADNDLDKYSEIIPSSSGDQGPAADDMITIRSGLALLQADYQEIILLRLVEGYKFKEIAEQMDKTTDAAKSLFRRALSALRQEIRISYD